MYPEVTALVLAAGSSRRMGRSKQLLPVNGRPAVKACVAAILDAGINDVIVVIGPRGQEIASVLDGLPVRIATNQDPEGDMAGSVRAGLAEAAAASTAVLVCLADHPLVFADTIRSLLQVHADAPDRIIIPSFQGRRGHPTLFPSKILRTIHALPTLRDVIAQHKGRELLCDVPDDGVILDMDTPRDYEAILERAASRAPATRQG